MERILIATDGGMPVERSLLDVLALRCTRCGARGTLVASYGPTASPEEADVLVRLTDTRR